MTLCYADLVLAVMLLLRVSRVSVGMQVLDNGHAAQLAPRSRLGAAVRQLTEPRRHLGLTLDQSEVLAIVIAEGMATRNDI